MTVDEYKAVVRALGLTPCRRSIGWSTIHQTRDGLLVHVADPELLTPEKRRAAIAFLKFHLGITDN